MWFLSLFAVARLFSVVSGKLICRYLGVLIGFKGVAIWLLNYCC